MSGNVTPSPLLYPKFCHDHEDAPLSDEISIPGGATVTRKPGESDDDLLKRALSVMPNKRATLIVTTQFPDSD